jgi:hypothetical protein
VAQSPRKTDAQNGGQTGVGQPHIKLDIADAGQAIKAARADLRLAARQTVAEAKKIGALLIAAQKIIPASRWLDWCRYEAGLSQKAVRRFAAVAASDIPDAVIAQDGLAMALTHCARAADEGGDDER